jgi:CoA:oxalate CoA-transferase
LYTDPQAHALNLVWELENRDVGKYKATGHPIRFSQTPVTPTTGAPVLGEHTECVLRQFGYGDEEIAQLKAMSVVK